MEGKKKMQKYKIFAGLAGGFGGAKYLETVSFATEEEANLYAWNEACEIYDRYAGLHGLIDWQDAYAEAECEFGDIDDNNRDEFEHRADSIYNEYREPWLSYWVELVE